jgi:hypothetical protein
MSKRRVLMNVQNETRSGRWQSVVQASQIGAGLQLVCIVLPLLDLWIFGSIERHVAAAYPDWGPAEVAGDRNAIVIYLVAVGAVGLLGWLVTIWTARRGRGVRATVTTLFVLGMITLITTAGISGGAYDQVVPLWLGLTLLFVLVLPGVTALVAAWSRGRR